MTDMRPPNRDNTVSRHASLLKLLDFNRKRYKVPFKVNNIKCCLCTERNTTLQTREPFHLLRFPSSQNAIGDLLLRHRSPSAAVKPAQYCISCVQSFIFRKKEGWKKNTHNTST
ncbi:hypothetical protein P8452_76521 [Trifolium repens]|nr:hypothetical protein P8452_76521 [Trifolium repens]